MDEETKPEPEAVAEVNPLQAELDATKAKLKQLREVYCLRDLNGVLDEHKCRIAPSPDGRLVVMAIE